jgi:hypothetical protein
MKITINQLNRELRDIADKHREIQNYFFGGYFDAISRDATVYPLMVATLLPSQLQNKATRVTVAITLADKYYEGKFETITDVHSRMALIIGDIRATFRSDRWREYIEVDEVIPVEWFENKGSDLTAGLIARVSFVVDDYENFCAAPYDGYDFEKDMNEELPQGECLPATWTLKDTAGDELNSGSIDSGDSADIEAPDANWTLKDTATNILKTGSIKSGSSADIEAPDADYEVYNSIGTPLAIGSVESGGVVEINISDSEAIINEETIIPVISGGVASNIWVQQDGGLIGSYGGIVGGVHVWNVPSCPKTLLISIPYAEDDDTIQFTVIANSDGTVTSVDTTGLTSVVINVEGSPVSVPFVLAEDDVVDITFDSASADGIITMTGTYT